MRPLAILIAILASVSAVAADSLPERVVGLFKETCVVPDAPEAMMAAGEKLAVVGSWRLIKSGRGPIPMMHNENGPPHSILSFWQLDLPPVSNIRFGISIVGPEIRELRYDSCLIQIPVRDLDESLAPEVDRQFGSSVFKRPQRYVTNVLAEWFFARNGERFEDCRRSIMLSRESHSAGTFTTLGYADVAQLKSGNWQGLLGAWPECRK